MGALEVGRLMGTLPSLLSRGATLMTQLDAATRNGLMLAPETVADIGRAEARRNRWSTAALWVIAALLAYLVWLMR
jgi:ubiquinone biosynthesis protein